MTGMRSYFLSIISVCLIAGIVRRLIGERGSYAAIGKFITGLAITIAVIAPLIDLNISDMDALVATYDYDAQQIIQRGQAQTADALNEIIKQKAEAYILREAEKLGAELTISITLTQEALPVPSAVHVDGNISPYAKNQLQSIIQSNLGIDKEHQIWT